MKKNILVFIDYYLPGYRAGGPIKSLANIITSLQDKFSFQVITRDHDFRDNQPYTSEAIQNIGANVSYLNERKQFFKVVVAILKHESYDLIYFNSFFSIYFTMIPYFILNYLLRLKKPIVIAPRGEFSGGALRIKPLKKTIFIWLMKVLNINQRVFWQATSQVEYSDIAKTMGKNARIILAPNIFLVNKNNKLAIKKAGILNVIFLSRITRKKNLLYAIKRLKKVSGKVRFDIVGVKEDDMYWSQCETAINALPQNIRVQYKGVASSNEVGKILAQYDLFFLPTLGENFGHAILESLMAGCPVLLSNLTPWDNLEQSNAGWAYALNEEQRFVDIIEHLIKMDDQEYRILRQAAIQYVEQYIIKNDAMGKTEMLFSKVINNACKG